MKPPQFLNRGRQIFITLMSVGVFAPLALFGLNPARAASNADGTSPLVSPSPLPSLSPLPPASASASAVPPKFAVDGSLGGVESVYAPILTQKLRAWPPAEVLAAAKVSADASALSKSDVNPIQLQCVETPGNRFYIGVIQYMKVAAPIQKVAAVLDDFGHYQDLFPDFDDVHVISREGNKTLTFWEQHIPVFFIPNVKYEVIYVVDAVRPDRKVYRYELAKEDHIKKNDGMIVLEADGPASTRYTEYDFFDADWGPLTTFAPGRIWKDSIEGIYLSDLAIALKAEHPDWSYKQISKESRKVLDRYPVDSVLENKIRILK